MAIVMHLLSLKWDQTFERCPIYAHFPSSHWDKLLSCLHQNSSGSDLGQFKIILHICSFLLVAPNCLSFAVTQQLIEFHAKCPSFLKSQGGRRQIFLCMYQLLCIVCCLVLLCSRHVTMNPSGSVYTPKEMRKIAP